MTSSTKVPFRKGNNQVKAPCADYFEVFPEYEESPETCHNRGPKEQRLVDNRNERVLSLVNKYFVTKEKG